MGFECPLCGKQINEEQIAVLEKFAQEEHSRSVFGTVPLDPAGYRIKALEHFMRNHEHEGMKKCEN